MGIKQNNRTVTFLVSITALLLVLAYAVFKYTDPDFTIRLHDDQIDIQRFTNQIAAFIIEEGYGHKVEMVESTIKEIHERLVTGDIHITLELWTENNLVWFQEESAKGSIQDLGALYSGGRQYWIIPQWYAVEKGIKTVTDMAGHWRDFANPEDPSKGIFFNCIFGWACRDINKVKLQAYGLDRYYNAVSPISPDALKSIYESAVKRKLPVFGYYWEPNFIMTHHDWYILEEPAYSEAVWLDIIRAAEDPTAPPPKQACAYKNNAVHKVAHRTLVKKVPDIVRMFEKMTIDINAFNRILVQTGKTELDQSDFESLALAFLKNQPASWHPWVTRAAKTKIEQALLKKESQSSRQ